MRLSRRRRSSRPPRDDYRSLYLRCLPQWADMYVSGEWTLEQFETHADAMRGLLAEMVGT